MSTSVEFKSSASENYLFTKNLEIISSALTGCQVNYSIVGGLALNAILGKNVNFRRANHTPIDFDAIVFGPDPATIGQALNELSQKKHGRIAFPELGIEPVIFSDQPAPPSPFTMLSNMRVDTTSRYFLTFRDIEVEVPPETMHTSARWVNGVSFSCLPAKTILFRYLTRWGMEKKKDDSKLHALEDYIIQNWTSEPDDILYRPYLEFAELIREKYPLAVALTDAFWATDYALGGIISGSPGFIYGLIKNFK